MSNLWKNQSQTCIISIDAASERALKRVRPDHNTNLQDNLSLRLIHSLLVYFRVTTRLNPSLIRANFEDFFARFAVDSEGFMSHIALAGTTRQDF